MSDLALGSEEVGFWDLFDHQAVCKNVVPLLGCEVFAVLSLNTLMIREHAEPANAVVIDDWGTNFWLCP